MTNFEKIKQMSVEEYADRNLEYFSCDDCSGGNGKCDRKCKSASSQICAGSRER